MTTDFSVAIPHRMRPEQTLYRLKTFATGAKREYAEFVDISREAWSARGCEFALTLHLYGKRRVAGTLRVDASHVHVQGRAQFPPVFRSRIERVIASEVSRLLPRVRAY
ncbi:MAG TPA: hypothetical protein VHJ78_12700 [Actinomycetota bacterium]|nr:hypothetical protein [Actinomycetota bacterium]